MDTALQAMHRREAGGKQLVAWATAKGNAPQY